MQESYGIKLEINASEVKKEVNNTKLKIMELTEKLKDLKTDMRMTLPGSSNWKAYAQDIIKTEDEIKNLKQEMKKMTAQPVKQVTNSFNGIKNSIGSIIKSSAKWLLAIFSIRSAYSLILKSISTLSQNNKQLSTDLSYIIYSVVKVFEPVVNFIVKAIYKVLQLLNSVVYSLFKVNLFANASASGFKNANSSAKSLKQTLAGFDTITTINQDTGLAGGYETPSVDLSKTVDLKNIDWGKIWSNIKTGISNVVSKTINFIEKTDWAKVGSTIGEKVWTAITNINWVEFIKKLIKFVVAGLGAIDQFMWGLLEGSFTVLKNTISKFFSDIRIKLGIPDDWYDTNIKPKVEKIKSKIISLIDNIGIKIGLKSRLWEDIIKPKLDQIKQKIENFKVKLGIDVKIGDTSDFKSKIKSIFSGVGYSVLRIISPGLASAKNIYSWLNSFDVGTNYVPNDQLAMVHKGEMIVPAKYNPATSGIGTGNNETNTLLRTLITTLENKDTNVYMDSKKVGQSVTNYINNQNRIMGRSII